jgi:hypothetical protein
MIVHSLRNDTVKQSQHTCVMEQDVSIKRIMNHTEVNLTLGLG